MTQQKKLSLLGLIAIVFGTMIGSGIFNIAQNMAAEAGLGAVVVSWLITAVGIVSLVLVFNVLSERRPDLDAGIYQYAKVGFGNYAGFSMAWGYWLCTAFGNATFAVMLNDAFGAFFPVLLRHGWYTVGFCSVFIWTMYAVVSMGISTASVINTVITFIKFACLIFIVAILIIYFSSDVFVSGFTDAPVSLGGFGEQVKSTMLVTIWCFLGIEGAMMMSARAKRKCDVGRAGIIGFVCAWSLYFVISVLCFGIMTQVQMSGLENPSLAYVLRACCGDWAYYFVVISVIVALLGGSVAWSLICAQVPYEAAKIGMLPKRFLRTNRAGVPICSLFVSSMIMQVFITLVVFAESVYLAAVQITSMMVLPAYMFCGLYLWKATYRPERYLRMAADANLMAKRALGIVCTAFCVWFMYAGGLGLLLMTSLFYLAGTFYYIEARTEQCGEHGLRRLFTWPERCAFAVLVVCGIASLVMLCTGNITF